VQLRNAPGDPRARGPFRGALATLLAGSGCGFRGARVGPARTRQSTASACPTVCCVSVQVMQSLLNHGNRVEATAYVHASHARL